MKKKSKHKKELTMNKSHIHPLLKTTLDNIFKLLDSATTIFLIKEPPCDITYQDLLNCAIKYASHAIETSIAFTYHEFSVWFCKLACLKFDKVSHFADIDQPFNLMYYHFLNQIQEIYDAITPYPLHRIISEEHLMALCALIGFDWKRATQKYQYAFNYLDTDQARYVLQQVYDHYQTGEYDLSNYELEHKTLQTIALYFEFENPL